jgi:ABC-type phosphate transport system substrate-binding protein
MDVSRCRRVFKAGIANAGDDLSYSGSSTIGMSVLEAGAVKDFEQKTGIKFKSVEQPGSGKGIQALLDGKVTLAGASRTLKSEEKAKKLLGTAIGYDAIAVFVHKKIKGIFSGKIMNWKEVGARTRRCSRTPRSPTRSGRRCWHFRKWPCSLLMVRRSSALILFT